MKRFKNKVLFTARTVFMFLMLPLICFAGKLNANLPETNTTGEATQLFIHGREAFEMGRTSDAILYFDKALQKDAQYASAWLYKSIIAETDAEQNSSISKALRFRNNATEGERIQIDIELTYADNNSEKRFELAKQLAGLQPENARALLVLAGEYQAQGKISKFRDLAHEAIRVEPESPLGYRALAASWLLNEPVDFSLAEKYMQKFVELRPGEASAHIALGDVYRALLNLEKAKKAYSKAIEIDPENYAALSKRGYIHTYRGMFDEARADFKKALSIAGNIQDYSKPNGSMISYLSTSHGMETTPVVEVTSKKHSNNKRLLLNDKSDNCYFCCNAISMSYGLFVPPDESFDACRCLLNEFDKESKTPDETTIEANIAFMRGFRAIQEENYELAKQIIEDYSHTINPEMKPKKNEAHNFLAGLIYSGKGKYNKALSSFKKSDTGNVFVKYNTGLVYDKLGMHEKANKEFTEVAEFYFGNASDTGIVKRANVWLKSYEKNYLAQK